MRKRKMKNLGTAGYKLLTPGPLTTTETVKEVMLLITVHGTMITKKSRRRSAEIF